MVRIGITVALSGLVAAAFAGTPASLHFLGTGKGGNLQISSDFGSNWLTVFSGELNVERCDVLEPSFYTYCTSANVYMLKDSCWDVDLLTTSSMPQNGSAVGWMVNGFAPTYHTSADIFAQALQAAVWEMSTETTGIYDVVSGSFVVRNADGSALDAGVYAIASFLTSSPGSSVATWYESHLNGDGHKLSQDLVAPVPEPTMLALLAPALLLRRRRK